MMQPTCSYCVWQQLRQADYRRRSRLPVCPSWEDTNISPDTLLEPGVPNPSHRPADCVVLFLLYEHRASELQEACVARPFMGFCSIFGALVAFNWSFIDRMVGCWSSQLASMTEASIYGSPARPTQRATSKIFFLSLSYHSEKLYNCYSSLIK